MSKETLEQVIANVAEVTESTDQDEAIEEQSSGEQNRVVCRALFLSAQESAKTGKLGITILLVDSIDQKGQVKVSLEQRKMGNGSYTVSPVISTWFDPKKTETDVFEKMKAYLNKGGLCDVYAVVSGNNEFRKIHSFLTTEELNLYRKLIGG